MAVDLEQLQANAKASANEFKDAMDDMKAKLLDVANNMNFYPYWSFMDKSLTYDMGPITDMKGTIKELKELKPGTLKAYPNDPSALGIFFEPTLPNYSSPAAPSPAPTLLPVERPQALTVNDPGAAPDLTPPELQALDSIKLPTAPETRNLDVPEISYITIPAYDVKPIDTSGSPDASVILSKTFDWIQKEYESNLLTELQTVLLNDLVQGGYGINPADEMPLWERERERELINANTTVDQVTAQNAARGFVIPPGAMMAMVEGAMQSAMQKISSVNRDIGLKRADMYVENRKFTISTVKDVESMLITYFGYQEERALKAAQITVELAVSTYNALATVFNIKVQAYKTQIEAYNARVQAALAPYERDKLMLQAASTQAQVEQTKAGIYETQVRGAVAGLEVNKLRLEQDRLTFDMEKTKLDAYLAKVQGFKSMVEAKASEWQGYAAAWEGNKATVSAYAAQVGAYSATIEGAVKDFDARARETMNKYEVRKLELQTRVTELQAHEAKIRATGAENQNTMESYRIRLGAYGEQIRGYVSAASALSDYYKAVTSVSATNAQISNQYSESMNRFALSKAQISGTAISAAMQGYSGGLQGFASAAGGLAAQVQNV